MDDLGLKEAEQLLAHMRANANADPVKLLASVALRFMDMYLEKHIADMKALKARGHR